MSGLYRVWARVRQPAAREWDRHRTRPFLAHQAGHPIVVIGFKQSFGCENYSKSNGRLVSGMIHYNLSNYNEHITRDKLATRALRHGLPATILRATLGVNASRRYVALRDLV
eukprot:5710342-Pyramimonas_sp.AAC.1